MTKASTIAKELLDIIVCPQCHSALQLLPDPQHVEALLCTGDACGLRYPVRDGIPILLIDEATRER